MSFYLGRFKPHSHIYLERVGVIVTVLTKGLCLDVASSFDNAYFIAPTYNSITKEAISEGEKYVPDALFMVFVVCADDGCLDLFVSQSIFQVNLLGLFNISHISPNYPN